MKCWRCDGTGTVVPAGHPVESTAENKLNNGVCPFCNKWFGPLGLPEHLRLAHKDEVENVMQQDNTAIEFIDRLISDTLAGTPTSANQLIELRKLVGEPSDFDQRTAEREAGNLEKHGRQTFQWLTLCTMEELGEICRAHMECQGVKRVREEIIDAAALLRRMYTQAGER